MKPYKTLLILLVFLVFLFGPSFFIDGPLRISSDFSLKFPEPPDKLLSLFIGKEHIAEVDSVSGQDSTMAVNELFETVFEVQEEATFILPVPIEFSDSSLLWSSIIDSIKSGEGRTRITYFGDSQMEGDRITDYLRASLREYGGGTGPGLLSPTMLVPYTRTTNIRLSQSWKRYNFISSKTGEIDHRRLGPMLSISRFTPPEDTLKTERKAWFRISPSVYADSLSSVYSNIRLFYGNLKDSVIVSLTADGRWLITDTLIPISGVAEYACPLPGSSDLRLDFSGRSSPDIYGLSLESEEGIIIDNIPGRGSAGLEFSQIDRTSLEKLFGYLKPDLLILHYGLNVVLNESDNYTYYENGIYRQVKLLKEILPATEVLVIGLTDMARSDGNEIHSYPNIPLIIDAQRRAAQRAGALFWDSREAMGGIDAIVKWRLSDPPLASDDFTHLSYEGGHMLAAKLIESMLAGSEKVDSAKVDTVRLSAPATTSTIVEDESGLSEVGDIKIWEKAISSLAVYDPSNPYLFTNSAFWIFLLILLIGYSIIFNSPLLRNSYLFLFSLFFYFKSGGLFFILLLVSTLTDYSAGLMIHYARRKAFKRVFLILSLVVNLGMLGYFKYSEFLTLAVNDLFSTSFPVIDWLAFFSNNYIGTSFDIGTIILPVGISFFTFQTISYTMDMYRGKSEPVRNILDFGFYVSFFPQLVAGPIVRASEFIPQLYARFSLSKREWSHALFLVMNGLIKKIIISDYISVNLIDRVFAYPELYSGFENLLSVYGYGLQIYCDFSGYTDIAIGVALFLGYRLPLNFNSPYKAASISDFWRRWHISLSRWLKDYLYISLGGNRRGRLRTNINLLVTMLLGGLWHGAAWRFVIWGGLHGSALVLHKAWTRLLGKWGRSSRLWRFISILITFNFVSFCWIFFRAGSLNEAKFMIGQIVLDFSPGNWIDVLSAYGQVITVIIAGYILHFLPAKIKESYRGLFIRMPLIVKMLIVYLLAIAMFNFQSAGVQPFIYFRF